MRKRISATMAVLKGLDIADIAWLKLKSQCSRKWKFLVYNAVIKNQVLYGLETLEPNQPTQLWTGP